MSVGLKSIYYCFFLSLLRIMPVVAAGHAEVWSRYELSFVSDREYTNPIYEVKQFGVKFISPTGRVKNINGFWDGSRNWKVRFAPDEKGQWIWESFCSDAENRGLNLIKGVFVCSENNSRKAIYQHGTITHPRGLYHLAHADGTPFFWAGCTAWNGALKSTDQEWETYLTNRAEKGYSVIQFVTTQWRGCDKNSLGQVAFEGSGQIKVNPGFFRHLDGKIDAINRHGLVAAPVLLWALATVQGRELSPGYYLPEEEAVLLSRYMVARYGGNHVIWILGGDGKYTGENEQRWKNIGRAVFGDEHPGLVALHPGGASWIGEAFANEHWLDIIGYQSGHSTDLSVLNFINKGPVALLWNKLPPRPIINMEPVYEEIHPGIRASDIRNVGYWSIFNAPTAGFTYGANGIWPWLREGEVILNHSSKGETSSRWNKALDLPGSVQIGYMAQFIRLLEWWKLKPAPELLAGQPGDEHASGFISVSRTDDNRTIVIYLPKAGRIKMYNPDNSSWLATWFNPATNRTTKGAVPSLGSGFMEIVSPAAGNDWVLILKNNGKLLRDIQ